MNVVYVTGNAHKAKYFNKMVGLDIAHQKADVDELQTMDLEAIVKHKAQEAYALIGKPVIVEDTSARLGGMGQLPGPYIKWFIEELGLIGACKLATTFDPVNRGLTVGAMIAYYDGKNMQVFKSELAGKMTIKPIGDTGFGWNAIFIPNGQPEGQSKTLGQMEEAEFTTYYKQIKPFDQVRKFLDNL